MGRRLRAGFTATARHAEVVDPYRSGVPARPAAVATRPDVRGQRGSTLLLFPAALLIVVALAAVTVDSAIAFMAQRELANATAAAANDAATEGLSEPLLPAGPHRTVPVRSRVHRRRPGAGLVDPVRHHGLAVTARRRRRPGAGCSAGPSGAGLVPGRRAVRPGDARLQRDGGGPSGVDRVASAGRRRMLNLKSLKTLYSI